MSSFNLGDLISKVRDEVGPDPEDIAAKVYPQIPSGFRHDIFLMLLKRYVIATAPRLMPSLQAAAKAHAAAKVATPPGVSTRRISVLRAQKISGYIEYDKLLKTPVPVGRGLTKTLAECGQVDLAFASDYRRNQAEKNLASSEQFSMFVALLIKYKVKTVGELPRAALDEVFSSISTS